MADETVQPETDPTESAEPSLKDNIKTGSTWLRGFFMVLFAIFYGFAEFLMFAVAIFQFLTVLVSRKTNDRVSDFGRNLARYIYEVMLYLTYNIDERPFPFSPWPTEKNITPSDDTDIAPTVEAT